MRLKPANDLVLEKAVLKSPHSKRFARPRLNEPRNASGLRRLTAAF